jgi:hypothetical protein
MRRTYREKLEASNTLTDGDLLGGGRGVLNRPPTKIQMQRQRHPQVGRWLTPRFTYSNAVGKPALSLGSRIRRSLDKRLRPPPRLIVRELDRR